MSKHLPFNAGKTADAIQQLAKTVLRERAFEEYAERQLVAQVWELAQEPAKLKATQSQLWWSNLTPNKMPLVSIKHDNKAQSLKIEIQNPSRDRTTNYDSTKITIDTTSDARHVHVSKRDGIVSENFRLGVPREHSFGG